MDSHLAVLLEAIREHRESGSSDESVYVWWAKVRSRNRVSDVPHNDLIAEIASKVAAHDAGSETHLYLTDYRSLYVGQVVALTSDDVRSAEPSRVAEYMKRRDPPAHKLAKGEVPPYQLAADWWFKLADIRRLVLDDTVAVVRELAVLQNTQYHGRPVSLYGGMVDLPLVVTRADGRRYFLPEDRDHLSSRKWWVELDAERGRGIAQVERDLRDNVLGEDAWQVFDPTARAFIADAERLFRNHRRDAAFDFSGVIVNFGKAVEVHFRWLVQSALLANPKLNSVVTVNDKPRDLRRGEMPSLGQFAYLIQHDPAFRAILSSLINGDWLMKAFLPYLGKLAPIRNKAAHDQRVDLATAQDWRDSLLGIGRYGLLEQLATVRPTNQVTAPSSVKLTS